MVEELLYGFFLVVLLVISSGLAVDIFEKIAHEIKINKLLVATFLVSMTTSLPELSVGLASSLRGQPQIALGNLIGANLANLSWIVGGAAVLSGTIPVIGEYLRRDLWLAMGLAITPFLLMTDGKLSRPEGFILIVVYMFYVKYMVSSTDLLKHSKLKKHKKTHWKIKSFKGWAIHIAILVAALSFMAFVSYLLIGVAEQITTKFGVNPYWIGLLVISFGTTLPELALSLMASERRDVSLLLGNILGSVVVNSTFILGIIAVISPIVFESSVQKGLSGLFLIFILGLFWLFTKSKHKLERWEGLTLIGVYLMFVGLQFIFA